MSKEHEAITTTTQRISDGSRKSRRISTISNRNASIKPKPLVRIYQPTYQLNPRKRFKADHIEKVLKRVVDSELEEMEYNEKVVPEICITLADMIRNEVKKENYDRYRIIVYVSIGQKRQQGVHLYHGFLWDSERDAFAAYNFENCHIYANVVVYGIYQD